MSRFVARIAHRGKQESGAVLVITAIMIVAFIGLAALAIDVGSFYQAQRQAQAAADAAALAGVNDLPTSQALATTAADNYVAQNYPGTSTPIVTYPSTTQIKVVVNANTPSFFGQIFGITSANVSATAIAGQPTGSTPAALFAMDSTCTGDGIKISGNNIKVPGGITDNGTFSQSGTSANNTFGGTTFGGPNNCTDTFSTSSTYANPGGAPTALNSLTPWPLDYSSAALKPACTQSGVSFNFATTSNTDAVYCATGNITIAGGVSLPNATLIADSFTFSGTGISVGSASTGNGLSIYETGISPLVISHQNFTANTIFAPQAEVQISGDSSNNTLTGFVEGYDVTLVTNNYTIIGTGPPSFGFVGALVG